MSTWLKRFLKAPRARASAGRVDALRAHFYKRSLYRSSGEFFEALVAHFAEGHTLSDAELQLLITELRGVDGAQTPPESDIQAHLNFWEALWRKTGSVSARGCFADTLLLAGRKRDAMRHFIEVFEVRPELMSELGDEELDRLARQQPRELWLRYSLAWLRAAMEERRDEEDDTIRERYSELLEEFADSEDALTDIRNLGQMIKGAASRGQLPRALVRRGPTRER